VPTAELCNGLDDDCDGSADDGDPGAGVACTTSLPGACAPGTTACAGPSGIVCAPDVQPGSLAETCNTVDDDCDGEQDEDWPLLCAGMHPAAQHVGAWGCAPSGCAPTCEMWWDDVDGLLANGCECAVNEAAPSCATAASAVLDVAVEGDYPLTGTLPSPGDEDWRLIHFSPLNPAADYGKFTLTDAAGGTFRMDVMTACGTYAPCLGGGVGQNVPQCTVAVGVDYRVRVYRADPSVADCNDSFTLTVSLYDQ